MPTTLTQTLPITPLATIRSDLAAVCLFSLLGLMLSALGLMLSAMVLSGVSPETSAFLG